MSNKASPIGIFDSGIGGLTVVKEIIRVLPDENLIYFGDTARVPYGNRGKEVITGFALEITKFLLEKKVKALVVACNTMSAVSLAEIEKISSVPVIGVIKPTIKHAIAITKSKRVGVIGTRATINSKVYEKLIKSENGAIQVYQQSCPLFVPLAEEGYFNHPAAKLIASEYLSKFEEIKIDTLILGCTHYPLLTNLIQNVVGKKITIVDSAKPTAAELKSILIKNNLLNNSKKATKTFYITDAPERVYQTANLFFDYNFPGQLEKVIK